MRKVAFMTAVLVCLIATSCQSVHTGAVPYELGHNYFFNNDTPIPASPKITTKAQFDKLFSPSPVMGTNGEPSKIDFSRQFVIAKMLPVTNYDVEIRPVSLTLTADKKLSLNYFIRQGEKRTYSIKPMFFIIVDRKYDGYDIEEHVEKR